jgi:hypothetical protein
MITNKQLKQFLKDHNISRYDKKYCDYYILFYSEFDEKFPKEPIISLSLDDKDSEYTKFLFKPLKNLYFDTKPDGDGDYEFDSYGMVYIPLYKSLDLNGFITSLSKSKEKNIVKSIFKNTPLQAIPFNTMKQMEIALDYALKYTYSLIDTINGDSFNSFISQYSENIMKISNIKKINNGLKSKSINVLKKKLEILEDL